MIYRFKHTDAVIVAALLCLEDSAHCVDLIYDISCEFSKKLQACLETYGDELPDWVQNLLWQFFIPKFHIPAHGPKCQTRFLLNWTCGSGRAYGERIEQEWAHIKKCASATRKQGDGARHLLLDFQWGGWNFRMMICLGMI
jgi:hypothetical protein